MKYAHVKMDYPSVSVEEFMALSEVQEFTLLSSVILYEGNEYIAHKSASIKYSGDVILLTNDEKDAIEAIKGLCANISVHNINDKKEDAKKKYIDLFTTVSQNTSCPSYDIFFTDGLTIVGKRRDSRDTRSLLSHSKKPFSQSGSLNSFLARILVNVSRAKKTFYDPFSGLGSTLIEASWKGIWCIGSDFNREILTKSVENLRHFKCNCDVFLGTIQTSNVFRIDGIGTDPPYARSTKIEGLLRDVFHSLFSYSAEVLPPNGYLVFLSDSKYFWGDDIREYGLTLLRTHYLYTHKSMTRVLYVVKKP
ncbi:RNA methyltransferase [Sulfolobales archaeon HS-7]|nr:RNA methyltransferase [Sulfolobales archaeon HS-7]